MRSCTGKDGNSRRQSVDSRQVSLPPCLSFPQERAELTHLLRSSMLVNRFTVDSTSYLTSSKLSSRLSNPRPTSSSPILISQTSTSLRSVKLSKLPSPTCQKRTGLDGSLTRSHLANSQRVGKRKQIWKISSSRTGARVIPSSSHSVEESSEISLDSSRRRS